MSRTVRGRKGPGADWWSRRPNCGLVDAATPGKPWKSINDNSLDGLA